MTDKSQPANDDGLEFDALFHKELETLAELREDGPSIDEKNPRIVGLAFSGGGIRSATFNLGFLQGLANRGTLPAFDYLSTVSGGGYIGAWFSALLKRRGKGAPCNAALTATVATTDLANNTPRSDLCTPDHKAVRFVRRYADYLTPRVGLSGDTLALVSVALRNFVVIQLLLLSLLVAIFSSMLLVARHNGISILLSESVPFMKSVASALRTFVGCIGSGPGWLWGAMAIVAMIFSLWKAISLQPKDGKTGNNQSNNASVLSTFMLVVLPALISGLFVTAGLEESYKAARTGQSLAAPYLPWVVAVAYFVVWLPTYRRPIRLQDKGTCVAAIVAGLLWAALYFGINPLGAAVATAPFGRALALAPVVALGLYSFFITVHLALAGSAISESSREWWARVGGLSIAVALAWTFAFGFLLYVPPLLQHFVETSLTGGALWAGLSWLGARFANSADISGQDGPWWKNMLSKLAPAIFIVGLLGLVAWAYTAALLGGMPTSSASTLYDIPRAYWSHLGRLDVRQLLAITIVAGAMFIVLSRLIDLNIFSAHAFYRNRLARTFLGASHDDRHPNPFTGFDPDDDLFLHELQKQRPIHLINANVNLTGGDDLAWQTRRGASFVFSPHGCGYSTYTTSGIPIGRYRDTREYAGGTITLATAVAVSGAAASPNMGFHTSASVAALLTLFNMRLARWCPNPRRDQWNKADPRWGGSFLFAELFGLADGQRNWLNLSDGGHFDNLGIYELARRRAALILATDAGEDADYHFDDLAMLKRKLWTDFGVDLHIDETALAAIRPGAADPEHPDDPRFSNCHWACGRLIYPGGKEGLLIYVKSSLTPEIPLDVRQYKDTHPLFPHESTADQWFNEDQFEAYRHLGQYIAEKLLDELTPSADGEEHSTEKTVAALIDLARRGCATNKPDEQEPPR